MVAYHPVIHRFPSLTEASKALADYLVTSCLEEIDEKGYFTLVLSGGSTPKLLYEMLGTSPYAERIPWHNVYLFWGDERCVPRNHEYSNFQMVNPLLLSRIDIPAENLMHIDVGHENQQRAAQQYERMIADFFTAKGAALTPGKDFPKFDFLLQGMGSDGHTASLFPDDAALLENRKWVAWVAESPTQPKLPRLTMTLPVFNHGKRVVFLVSGKDKSALLDKFLRHPDTASRKYPAAMINPTGRLLWYIGEN